MKEYDLAVIGGGPAGLHAALKAALLYRTAILFDKGRTHSRIFFSPRVDNLPGRLGIAGRDIIKQGYEDIRAYEKSVDREFVTVHEKTEVTTVSRDDDGYVIGATGPDGELEARARAVILATGAVDSQPKLRDFRKRDIEAVLPYANKGYADYCLLCDGHTVEGKRVAVLGCDPGSRGIAKSLKANFGADTVVVPYCNPDTHGDGPRDPKADWAEVEEDLAKWDIPILYGDIESFTGIKDGQFGIVFADGTEERFDKAWISMGWYKVNSEPAAMVGAQLDEHGFVVTNDDLVALDADGEPIPHFYAVGDVRAGSWKQIPIAWGEAEQAVIDAFVHNRRTERLQPPRPT